MKKFISKNPIINMIIGIIFIAFFLSAYFFTDWLLDSVTMIIAALIVIFSLTRYYRDYNNRSGKALLILTGEFAIALMLAALLIFETIGESVAVGLVLYLRGLIFLLISQLLKQRMAFEKFITAIAILTLGAYVLFSGLPLTGQQMAIVVMVFGVVIGAFYLITGIHQKTKNTHKISQEE